VLIHLPDLAVDQWLEIDTAADTGLASANCPISCLVPDEFPAAIFVGTAKVVTPGKVRLRFHNGGLYRSPALDTIVRLLPYETKLPLMPEVTFNLPENL
jgi:hypothetical protein